LTPEPSQEPFVPLHVATVPRHELEISELEDPSPVDQFNNMPSPAISVEEFGIQGSSEEELHTPIDGLHTPVEELQDPLNHRQHIGRFGTVNLMTPIAERTMEFTASTLRSVANTPSRGVSARESQQYALYMANKHAGELREEDEEGEEPQNVAATLWPTKATEADEHADVSMKAVALPIDDGEGLEVSNPCHPHEPEVLAYALQDLTSLEGFHDLSMETGGHLDVLQKFAKRNDSHAHLPLTIAGRKFFVSRKLGEGGFGAVFAARDGGVISQDDDDSSDDEDDEAEDNVALKVVRPRNRWEFHIIRHIHAVLPEELRRSIILPSDLFVFRDESFLVLELRTQGTLLEMVNKAAALQLSRPGQPVDELLVMYFAIELLRTLEGLHREGIIHGDLKIDNCLIRLQEVPGSADSWSPQYQADGSDGWAYKGISLIDFGRAVNTRLFPPDQTFFGDWPTDARDCLEAREGRPWTYQTDYFGLAGIVYCMLFGKYIDASSVILNEQDGRYKFASPIKRYWQIDIWTALFDVLLNPTMVHADGRLPLCDELGALRNEMEAWLEKNCKRQGQQSLKSSLKRIERGVL
jgi:checkpoint serine/threonine-protein kinase